jgi:hypothetical protein
MSYQSEKLEFQSLYLLDLPIELLYTIFEQVSTDKRQYLKLAQTSKTVCTTLSESGVVSSNFILFDSFLQNSTMQIPNTKIWGRNISLQTRIFDIPKLPKVRHLTILGCPIDDFPDEYMKYLEDIKPIHSNSWRW